MARTITVKASGKISVKPDLVSLTLTLNGRDASYENAVEESAKQLEALKKELTKIGFEESVIKTSSFNVHTEFESVKDDKGNYNRVFSGYNCAHCLKIEFDFDKELLSKTIGGIANCLASPELYINFKVKDITATNEKLLKIASSNAKKKAKILAKASDVKLGELLSIDYNFGGINPVSKTGYAMDNACLSARKMSVSDVNITPEDVVLEETVIFVWEIM